MGQPQFPVSSCWEKTYNMPRNCACHVFLGYLLACRIGFRQAPIDLLAATGPVTCPYTLVPRARNHVWRRRTWRLFASQAPVSVDDALDRLLSLYNYSVHRAGCYSIPGLRRGSGACKPKRPFVARRNSVASASHSAGCRVLDRTQSELLSELPRLRPTGYKYSCPGSASLAGFQVTTEAKHQPDCSVT